MIIIFDLDGTLINTIDDLGQACNHALAACGFPRHKIEDYPRLVGNGINKLIERALPEEDRNEETVLRAREYFVPYYDEHNCDLTRPYDGILALLHTLKEQGHQLKSAPTRGLALRMEVDACTAICWRMFGYRSLLRQCAEIIDDIPQDATRTTECSYR